MKRTGIIVLIVCFPFMACAAQPLTKQQMLEDFDQFYTHITSCVPHFGIRKKVTGHDIPKEIKRLRQDIDTVTCDEGFYNIISRAMLACNDAHISYHESEDSVVTAHSDKAYASTFGRRIFKSVIYIDGKYYTPGFCNKDKKEIVPYMSRLTHVNGIPVDKYVAKYNHWYVRSHYDFKNKKEWTSKLTDARICMRTAFNTWTVIKDGKAIDVDMAELDIMHARNYFDDFVFKVDYFDRDSTLYVRIPQMNINKATFLEEEIAKHKDKSINRVVIDVRDNKGGSDLTWHRVLSAIIDNPLRYSLRQALKDTTAIKLSYTILPEMKVYGDRIIPFLDEDSETILEPSERSILYGGPIYVMVNEYIFSSTYSLLAVCQRSDRLISVGAPSGYLGGIGGTPKVDVLKHSRLVYRYPYILDVTDIDPRNPRSYYKDMVDIEVWPTTEECNFQLHYNKAQHAEEFLYNYDWTFKKILELDN